MAAGPCVSPSFHLRSAYLALALAVAGLGFSAIIVRWAAAPGVVAGFYRVAIAAAVLALPFRADLRRYAPLSRRHVALAVLAGFFFAGDLSAWSTSVLITSAANATLFGNTAPLWVGLGALVVFRQRLRAAFWFGLLLAALGAMLILVEGFSIHSALSAGDLLALLAGGLHGAYFLVAERARQGLSTLSTWWISAFTGALALCALSLILRQPLAGYPLSTYWHLTWLALVSQVGAHLLVIYALGHLRASIVAPMLLARPALTAVLAVPLLKQPLSVTQIIGGLVVLAGMWIIYRSRDENGEAQPQSHV